MPGSHLQRFKFNWLRVRPAHGDLKKKKKKSFKFWHYPVRPGMVLNNMINELRECQRRRRKLKYLPPHLFPFCKSSHWLFAEVHSIRTRNNFHLYFIHTFTSSRFEKVLAQDQSHYSAIKRNEIGSFIEMWMDLEFVIQSEISQKEKNKYHMLTHIYGI